MSYAVYPVTYTPRFEIAKIESPCPSGGYYVIGQTFAVRPYRIIEDDAVALRVKQDLEDILNQRREMEQMTHVWFWNAISANKELNECSKGGTTIK